MGNIYVDEALWRARIHPLRPAQSLDRTELRRLHRAVRAALEQGIARQGSTLRDYALPDGGSGSMQDEFRVYGRGGEPCDRLRHADREDAGRRPRHVVLPRVPAAEPLRTSLEALAE